MTSPKVWIIKEQMRRTANGSEVMDFTPAMSYGELQFITKFDMPVNGIGSMMMVEWLKAAQHFIDEYDDSKDFIITTGKPSDIFMVGWLLGQSYSNMHNKSPRFLVWRHEENRYRVFDPIPAPRQLIN